MYVIITSFSRNINKDYSPFSATINDDVSIFPALLEKNIMLANEIAD